MTSVRRAAAAVYAHLRLGEMTTGARRGLAYLFVLMLLVVGGSFYQSSSAVNSLRVQLRADCRTDRDLGTAPLANNPATGRPSKLGVSIVTDFRMAWYGHGCPGTLPPPSPRLRKWAAYYHLPAN